MPKRPAPQPPANYTAVDAEDKKRISQSDIPAYSLSADFRSARTKQAEGLTIMS